jgi:hypothetical protein
MGGTSRARDALSSKGIIRVGNPKQKMAKKNSWSKSRQAVLFLALVLFHYYERESWRDERLREGYARGHTHTHREREFLKRVRDGVLLRVL